jgi:fructokinase
MRDLTNGRKGSEVDDVLVVGEALVDIVQRADGTSTEHPGGSPANVALGLGRLGRRVSLLSRIGDDARGERVRTHLTASGVSLVPGTIAAGPTSTATAVLDERGAASYEFALDWQLRAARLPGARALHSGSIAAFLAPGGDAVLDLVRRSSGQVTVSYDPNARPVLMGEAASARQRVEQFVAAADVVKVSDEDLGWLAPGREPADVAAAWLALGPAVVLVTRGPDGAFGLCADGRVDVPAPYVDVVDTVGAGDAFTSGLLDALATADLLGAERSAALRRISRDQLAAAARHATRVAAVTCSRPGADPPTRAELVAFFPAEYSAG